MRNVREHVSTKILSARTARSAVFAPRSLDVYVSRWRSVDSHVRTLVHVLCVQAGEARGGGG